MKNTALFGEWFENHGVNRNIPYWITSCEATVVFSLIRLSYRKNRKNSNDLSELPPAAQFQYCPNTKQNLNFSHDENELLHYRYRCSRKEYAMHPNIDITELITDHEKCTAPSFTLINMNFSDMNPTLPVETIYNAICNLIKTNVRVEPGDLWEALLDLRSILRPRQNVEERPLL